MKLFKRRLKRDNRGLSLVELVCAIAILGLTTTAIGSAMVVSAKSYQKNTVEFDVQQEAQTTTNLINNLVVDSTDAEFDASAEKLQLKKGDADTFSIYRDATTKQLKYQEQLGGGTIYEGVLAENVSEFKVDDTMFDSNKNLKVDLKFDKNGKVYETSYNTTSRNGEITSAVDADAVADIQIETEVVLEPGQTYEFPITMHGMTAVQAGGLVTDLSASTAWIQSGTLSATNDKIKFTVSTDAADNYYQFNVKTANYKDGTSEPLSIKTVTVYIRRVNTVDANITLMTDVSTKGRAGAVYRIDANVAGTSKLGRQYGKGYDNDYKSPYYVQFDFAYSGDASKTMDYIKVVTKNEDVNAPYTTVELLQDIPQSQKIVITATAKHPEGAIGGTNYNKTGIKYVGTSVTDTVEIEGVTLALYPDLLGLRKGDNDFDFELNPIVKQEIQDAVPSVQPHHFKKYMRIWSTDLGDSHPSGNDNDGWIAIDTTGDYSLKIRTEPSCLFDLLNTNYWVEVKLVAIDNGVLTWPIAGVTDRTHYIQKFKMEGSQTQFRYEPDGIYNFVAANTFTNASNRIELKTNQDNYIPFKITRFNVKMLKGDISCKIEKYVGIANDTDGNGDGYDIPNPDMGNIQVDLNESAHDEGILKWYINPDDPSAVNKRVGTYRITMNCNYGQYTYDYSTGSYSSTDVPQDIAVFYVDVIE